MIGGAPGNDDRGAGEHLRGNQPHPVGHGGEIRSVAYSRVRQALGDRKGGLWTERDKLFMTSDTM